jgi:hypothetical protein
MTSSRAMSPRPQRDFQNHARLVMAEMKDLVRSKNSAAKNCDNHISDDIEHDHHDIIIGCDKAHNNEEQELVPSNEHNDNSANNSISRDNHIDNEHCDEQSDNSVSNDSEMEEARRLQEEAERELREEMECAEHESEMMSQNSETEVMSPQSPDVRPTLDEERLRKVEELIRMEEEQIAAARERGNNGNYSGNYTGNGNTNAGETNYNVNVAASAGEEVCNGGVNINHLFDITDPNITIRMDDNSSFIASSLLNQSGYPANDPNNDPRNNPSNDPTNNASSMSAAVDAVAMESVGMDCDGSDSGVEKNNLSELGFSSAEKDYGNSNMGAGNEIHYANNSTTSITNANANVPKASAPPVLRRVQFSRVQPQRSPESGIGKANNDSFLSEGSTVGMRCESD